MLATRRPILLSPAKGDVAVAFRTLVISTVGNSNTLSGYIYSATYTGSAFDWGLLDIFAKNVRIKYGGVVQKHKIVDWQGNVCSFTIEFQIASDVPGNQARAAVVTLEIMPHGTVCTQDTSMYLLYDAFGDENFPGINDWLYNDDTMAGEHSHIQDGYGYLSEFDPGGGVDTGRLAKVNVDNAVRQWVVTVGPYHASCGVKLNGKNYTYTKESNSTGCKLMRFNDAGGAVEATYSAGIEQPDWEALPCDTVNGYFLLPFTPNGLRAVRGSDMTSMWTNTDPIMFPLGGGPNVPVPLLRDGYWHIPDANAKVWKINALTGVTASSLQLSEGTQDDTYCCPIWDEVRGVYYWANGGGTGGNKVYAINPGSGVAAPTVAWSVDLPNAATFEVRRPMALDIINGRIFVLSRLIASPYSSKLICLDADASGATLWTNTTAYDAGAAIAQVISDDGYCYCATTDYQVAGTYNKMIVVRSVDGVFVASRDMICASASCGVFSIGGGRLAVGLWSLTTGQAQQQGYQAFRVRASGGYGDNDFKFTKDRTGWTGSFMSGDLYVPSTSLDTTSKWDLFSSSGTTGGGSQSNGRFRQLGNGTDHRGLRSKITLARGSGATPGTQTFIRARNWPEATAGIGAWNLIASLSATFPGVEPVRIGRYQETNNWRVNHGGSDVLVAVANPVQRKDDTLGIRMHGNHVNLLYNGVSQYTRDDWNTPYDNNKLFLTCSNLDTFVDPDAAIELQVDEVRVLPFSYPPPSVMDDGEDLGG